MDGLLIQIFEIIKVTGLFFLLTVFSSKLSVVLYPTLDRPNIYSFSDTNSPKTELNI